MIACKAILRVLLVVAAALVSSAQAQTLPLDWRKINNEFAPDYELAQSVGAAYQGHHGLSLRRLSPARGQTEFGGAIQAARAAPWRGQRVLMRAWVKTERADAGALWLRIDAANDYLLMDNMGNRTIKGTTGWTRYEIVMDVPQQAEYLVYGVLLSGGGVLDVDDIEFVSAPPEAKTTTLYREGYMKIKPGQTYFAPRIVLDVPTNLGFEVPAP